MKSIPCMECGAYMEARSDDYEHNAFYLKNPVIIPNLPRYECPKCGDIMLSGDACSRIDKYSEPHYTDKYREKLARRKEREGNKSNE